MATGHYHEFFKIAKFYSLRPRHVNVPNFVKIGQSIAEILRFFVFFVCTSERLKMH